MHKKLELRPPLHIVLHDQRPGATRRRAPLAVPDSQFSARIPGKEAGMNTPEWRANRSKFFRLTMSEFPKNARHRSAFRPKVASKPLKYLF
jgi:hypothetical protein